MPLESITCTSCGATDVQEVKADTYFCNHCEGVFRYARRRGTPSTCSCGILATTHCGHCGTPICRDHNYRTCCPSCISQFVCSVCGGQRSEDESWSVCEECESELHAKCMDPYLQKRSPISFADKTVLPQWGEWREWLCSTCAEQRRNRRLAARRPVSFADFVNGKFEVQRTSPDVLSQQPGYVLEGLGIPAGESIRDLKGEESIREPFVTSSSGVRVQLPKSYDAKLVVRAVQSFCRSYTNARTFEVVFRSCKKSKLPRISSPFVVSVGDERIKYGMIDAEHLRTYIFSGCPLVWGNRRTVIFGDGSFLADLGPMNAQDEKHKTSEVVNRFFCMVDVLTVDSRVDIMSSTDFMANLERNEWIRLIESLWSIKSLQKYNSRASRERSRS